MTTTLRSPQPPSAPAATQRSNSVAVTSVALPAAGAPATPSLFLSTFGNPKPRTWCLGTTCLLTVLMVGYVLQSNAQLQSRLAAMEVELARVSATMAAQVACAANSKEPQCSPLSVAPSPVTPVSDSPQPAASADEVGAL